MKKIEKDQKKDFWMNAQEAIDYGIVDSLADKIKKVKTKRKKKR